MRSSRKGFTLIELLVVIGIIALLTAMAMPAISKFIKGQKLDQTGRLTQGAFQEARRSAITQRARHYLFMGNITSTDGSAHTFGFMSYREGAGWEPSQVLLPAGIWPLLVSSANDTTQTADWETSPLLGCQMRIQDWTNGVPKDDDTQANVGVTGGPIKFAGPTKTIQNGVVTYQFLKDGTMVALNMNPPSAPIPNPNIYDLNLQVDYVNTQSTPADLKFRQDADPTKRCFMAVDLNTGRVRYRVVDTVNMDGGQTTTK